jgi:putative transposase
LNSKLHAVCDGEGRPVLLRLTEGQKSDHRGAAMLLPALPPARELLADRGYDSNRFRAELAARGMTPCIPSTKSRKVPLLYDKVLYRLSTAPPHREHVRPPQGLAPRRHTL